MEGCTITNALVSCVLYCGVCTDEGCIHGKHKALEKHILNYLYVSLNDAFIDGFSPFQLTGFSPLQLWLLWIPLEFNIF